MTVTIPRGHDGAVQVVGVVRFCRQSQKDLLME